MRGLIEKLEKLSLNYPCYTFLSGALYKAYALTYKAPKINSSICNPVDPDEVVHKYSKRNLVHMF